MTDLSQSVAFFFSVASLTLGLTSTFNVQKTVCRNNVSLGSESRGTFLVKSLCCRICKQIDDGRPVTAFILQTMAVVSF